MRYGNTQYIWYFKVRSLRKFAQYKKMRMGKTCWVPFHCSASSQSYSQHQMCANVKGPCVNGPLTSQAAANALETTRLRLTYTETNS